MCTRIIRKSRRCSKCGKPGFDWSVWVFRTVGRTLFIRNGNLRWTCFVSVCRQCVCIRIVAVALALVKLVSLLGGEFERKRRRRREERWTHSWKVFSMTSHHLHPLLTHKLLHPMLLTFLFFWFSRSIFYTILCVCESEHTMCVLKSLRTNSSSSTVQESERQK